MFLFMFVCPQGRGWVCIPACNWVGGVDRVVGKVEADGVVDIRMYHSSRRYASY